MIVLVFAILLVNCDVIKTTPQNDFDSKGKDEFTFGGIESDNDRKENKTNVATTESYEAQEYRLNGILTKTTVRRSLPIKKGTMYDELKSVMFYKPSEAELIHGMKSTRKYHLDSEDVRSNSRNSINNPLPVLYSPKIKDVHELERMESVVNKVNDKRHVVSNRDVKPVHENVEEDSPYHHPIVPLTVGYAPDPISENPQYNYEPYYSYGFNDYADKEVDEDPVSFKGIGFNYDSDYYDAPDPNQRNRRVGNYYPAGHVYPNYGVDYDKTKYAAGDSANEKGFERNIAFDKQEKGSNDNEQHKNSYENSGKNFRGIKDIVDKFKNRYGSENNDKESNFELKTISDKMDKRKGFRRVYHKDEYLEDNEFFDNTGHTAKSHEKGKSDMRNGRQEGALESHSRAALGEDAHAHHNAGAANQNRFANTHNGNDNSRGYDKEFQRHHDAKQKLESIHGIRT